MHSIARWYMVFVLNGDERQWIHPINIPTTRETKTDKHSSANCKKAVRKLLMQHSNTVVFLHRWISGKTPMMMMFAHDEITDKIVPTKLKISVWLRGRWPWKYCKKQRQWLLQAQNTQSVIILGAHRCILRFCFSEECFQYPRPLIGETWIAQHNVYIDLVRSWPIYLRLPDWPSLQIQSCQWIFPTAMESVGDIDEQLMEANIDGEERLTDVQMRYPRLSGKNWSDLIVWTY